MVVNLPKVWRARLILFGYRGKIIIVPTLYFTLLSNKGTIEHSVIHELGHSIETLYIQGEGEVKTKMGFDISRIREKRKEDKNPYDENYRKYERFNEIIRDMLTMETCEILHRKGIYLFEPKELLTDCKNLNTSNMCKNLLTEFLGKYRKEVMDALLFEGMEKLYNKIGQENFEELVDIVNKVDYLERCDNYGGLTQKLKNNEKDHPDVIEYYRQLERLEKVYDNMEKHISTEDALDILNSAVQATEEKTRMGQIRGVKEKLKNIIEKIKGKIQNNQGEREK